MWVYDYLQTFPTEVDVIWRRNVTGTSLLFLVNRYSTLLCIVADLSAGSPGLAIGIRQAKSSLDWLATPYKILAASGWYILHTYAALSLLCVQAVRPLELMLAMRREK